MSVVAPADIVVSPTATTTPQAVAPVLDELPLRPTDEAESMALDACGRATKATVFVNEPTESGDQVHCVLMVTRGHVLVTSNLTADFEAPEETPPQVWYPASVKELLKVMTTIRDLAETSSWANFRSLET